jgi:hypothetical protein
MIKEFTVDEIEESDEKGTYTVLRFSITTDMSIVWYRLCPNRRYDIKEDEEVIKKRIKEMKNELEAGLKSALRPNAHFFISDNPVKNIIYLSYPDGEERNYPGQNITWKM